MKVIIAGSREGFTMENVCKACKLSGFEISEVVSGTARGVDKLGEQFAEENGIPIKRFPADWDRLGKRAGYVRNEEMAKYADALIVLIYNDSKGSTHMLSLAKKYNLHILEVRKYSE